MAAARRSRRDDTEALGFYRAQVAAQGFDPAAPIQVPVVTKRQRHKAGPLTQAVFNAIKYNPETRQAEVDASVVPMTMNTDELPIVISDGEPEMTADQRAEAHRNGLL